MAEDASGVVIVAIPRENDYVWKISSEKIPHMTLCYLGDISDGPVLARIETFVAHLAKTVMKPFYMDVDHRGTLGPDNADVVFLKNKDNSEISKYRNALLLNDDIKLAYLSTEQYPEWTPHLTLGYPTSPAHPDDRDYPGVNYIQFDKVALWLGNYDGPTFQLEYPDEDVLAMSDIMGDVLEHHGVKGMKWGQRKDRAGGAGHVSEDAHKALLAKSKIKQHGTHSLSNHELQHVVNRMNLEQQYSRLHGEQGNKIKKGHKLLKGLLAAGATANTAIAFANSPAGTALKLALGTDSGGGRHRKVG